MFYCTLTEAPFDDCAKEFFSRVANESDNAFQFNGDYSKTRVLKFGSKSQATYDLWINVLMNVINQAREEFISEAEVVRIETIKISTFNYYTLLDSICVFFVFCS